MISQFERAVREGREAKEDFDELNGSVLETQRKEWIEAMEKASAERFVNPKAMDVYNAKLTKGTLGIELRNSRANHFC